MDAEKLARGGKDAFGDDRSDTVVKGAWIVSERDRKDSLRDINFQVRDPDVPHDQLELKSKVERALSVLHGLYGKDQPKFDEAFDKLLALAQTGLVGPKASPLAANEALATLQQEILDREASRVKNGYLRKLGLWSVGLLILTILPVAAARRFELPLQTEASQLLVLAGASGVGTWLSFASRKVRLTFFELVQLEEDSLDPSIRLIFVALLAATFGLSLALHLVDIRVGEFAAVSFLKSDYAAVLIGVLCGLSEKALPTRMLDQASQVFGARKTV